MVVFLEKPTESEGFEQIVDFMSAYTLRESQIHARVDGKEIIIAESSVRKDLQLTDEDGVDCLSNSTIFENLELMRWNSTYAMLEVAHVYEDAFVRYDLEDVDFGNHISRKVNHQMGDMSHHQDIYDNPSLSKKVFDNMKSIGTSFSGVITLLFENMLVPAAEEVGQTQDDDSLKFQELMDLCTRLSNKVLDSESGVIDIKFYFTDKIAKLEDRFHKLEEENRILKEISFKSAKVDAVAPVEDKEESFKQGRMIADIDEDVLDIDEEEPAEVEEMLEVVTIAKLMTEQDEAFERQLEAKLNANINWDDVIEKVKRSERQNNKVMSEIRPLFEKHYNSIHAFLEKEEEEVTIQDKEIKEEEATPLASKIMFEKPNVEARSSYHYINNYLDVSLVKKKYPLTHFTMEKMLKNVRLKVEEESEMSLELMRLVRRHLNEGYVPE
nr:zinc finger BED domain-containing protein RICESLEEPER 2 [Tanacetum cinerariifolium]